MKNLTWIMLLLLMGSLSSCGGCGEKNGESNNETSSTSSDGGGDASSETMNDAEPANLQEAMDQMQKSIKDSGLQQTEPVNFRELQKMTPEKLNGMERISKKGETAGAMGMKISTTESKYKDDDGNIIEIKIIDTGGFAMGLMGMAAWSMATIDKEDENGYEKTSTLDGFKCFEKCRTRNNSCELSLVAEKRFVVTASCDGCGMDKLKKTVKKMGLENMADLKPDNS